MLSTDDMLTLTFSCRGPFNGNKDNIVIAPAVIVVIKL
jgi:hypothetical protein